MTRNDLERSVKQDQALAAEVPTSPTEADTSSTAAAWGTPEGRYLSSSGRPLTRRIACLRENQTRAGSRVWILRDAVQRAEQTASERRGRHRGGDRPWPLRLTIPIGTLAEGLTAYVAMQLLVSSQLLAAVLAMLAALIGTGMAFLYANRRLNSVAVPGTARILEAIFVVSLTVLRYDSLRIQESGLLAAAGASTLTALISALGLLGIEEVLVETHSLAVSISIWRVSWGRWRCASSVARLNRINAEIKASTAKLLQHFLDFLITAEGMPLDETQRRVAALRSTLSEGEDTI